MTRFNKLSTFELKQKIKDIRGTNNLSPKRKKWSIWKILRNLDIVIALILELLERFELEEK